MKRLKRPLFRAAAAGLLALVAASCLASDGWCRGDGPAVRPTRDQIVAQYGGRTPGQWSETATGVKTRLDTGRKVVALTLDACGSENDGFDTDLIGFLVQQRVPATLFICGRWISKNPETFRQLAADPLFEIENHGDRHRPASVSGRSVYGIKGTEGPGELYDEIERNGRRIEELTGRAPRFYRCGTAYYDEIAVQLAESLGYQAAGFSVLGDAGATYSAARVKEALLSAQPGSIIICHMNHPEKETAEGVIAAVPELRRRGFTFVHLADYNLK